MGVACEAVEGDVVDASTVFYLHPSALARLERPVARRPIGVAGLVGIAIEREPLAATPRPNLALLL